MGWDGSRGVSGPWSGLYGFFDWNELVPGFDGAWVAFSCSVEGRGGYVIVCAIVERVWFG